MKRLTSLEIAENEGLSRRQAQRIRNNPDDDRGAPSGERVYVKPDPNDTHAAQLFRDLDSLTLELDWAISRESSISDEQRERMRGKKHDMFVAIHDLGHAWGLNGHEQTYAEAYGDDEDTEAEFDPVI